MRRLDPIAPFALVRRFERVAEIDPRRIGKGGAGAWLTPPAPQRGEPRRSASASRSISDDSDPVCEPWMTCENLANTAPMFDKILIANRGEVAVRIIRTARRLGIKTAIVYSEADRDSLAVEMADEAVFIGPPPAAQSYLVIDKIVDAARKTGAQAIHPGFGFLSEKAEFADRLAGREDRLHRPQPARHPRHGRQDRSPRRPPPKPASRCVPGFIGEIDGVEHAVQISEEIGYPVMIKATAGGGGKGIRVAYNRKDVEEGFPAVRAEAKGAFGDDRIFIEKFVTAPRHIEIQVMGDKHGNVVHLFERECSIQRRNQKVIEEAPSPLLDEKTRMAMGEQAVALSHAPCNYDSAGTVEFVASGADKSFYFLEMNTRLQVEHPVTRDDHRPRSGRADDPRRRRREARVQAEGSEDQRLGHREPHLRRRSVPQLPALASAACAPIKRPPKARPATSRCATKPASARATRFRCSTIR